MAEWYEDDMGGSPLGQVTSRLAGWLGFKDRPSRWAGSGHGRVEANAAGQETRLGTVAGLVRDAATATLIIVLSKKQHAQHRTTCRRHAASLAYPSIGPASGGRPGGPCAHVATDIRPTAHGLDCTYSCRSLRETESNHEWLPASGFQTPDAENSSTRDRRSMRVDVKASDRVPVEVERLVEA
jgi:hypothetical protein